MCLSLFFGSGAEKTARRLFFALDLGSSTGTPKEEALVSEGQRDLMVAAIFEGSLLGPKGKPYGKT